MVSSKPTIEFQTKHFDGYVRTILIVNGIVDDDSQVSDDETDGQQLHAFLKNDQAIKNIIRSSLHDMPDYLSEISFPYSTALGKQGFT